MFADVRNYTALAERMPLAELRHSLNVMFSAASDILVRNDALVDKFMGDAVMALFNAPIPNPKHRETAMRAAIGLLEAVKGLKLPFAIGIGLNTGVAITGNVGGGDVTDYTAMGDTVNVAARLSGLASGGEILAGVTTCEGLLDGLPRQYGHEVVRLQVKGKDEAVMAYRIYPLETSGAS